MMAAMLQTTNETAALTEPKPLDLSGYEPLLEGASEFLRMWNCPAGGVTCFIDTAPIGADPFVLGLALMDCVGHGANAYAQALGISAEEAMARILEGFETERENPTDVPVSLTGKRGKH
jgi:hypothetical protein